MTAVAGSGSIQEESRWCGECKLLTSPLAHLLSPFLSFLSHTCPERNGGRGVRGKLWAFTHQGDCSDHGKADIYSLPNSCWQLNPLGQPKLYRLIAKFPAKPLSHLPPHPPCSHPLCSPSLCLRGWPEDRFRICLFLPSSSPQSKSQGAFVY